MVNRLFEFSKLDLSELPLKMEAVDVGAEMRSIAEDYSDKAYVNVSADECTAEADREQLRRIAKNIIDNSIKYSGKDNQSEEERGIIWQRTENRPFAFGITAMKSII